MRKAMKMITKLRFAKHGDIRLVASLSLKYQSITHLPTFAGNSSKEPGECRHFKLGLAAQIESSYSSIPTGFAIYRGWNITLPALTRTNSNNFQETIPPMHPCVSRALRKYTPDSMPHTT